MCYADFHNLSVCFTQVTFRYRNLIITVYQLFTNEGQQISNKIKQYKGKYQLKKRKTTKVL